MRGKRSQRARLSIFDARAARAQFGQGGRPHTAINAIDKCRKDNKVHNGSGVRGIRPDAVGARDGV